MFHGFRFGGVGGLSMCARVCAGVSVCISYLVGAEYLCLFGGDDVARVTAVPVLQVVHSLQAKPVNLYGIQSRMNPRDQCSDRGGHVICDTLATTFRGICSKVPHQAERGGNQRQNRDTPEVVSIACTGTKTHQYSNEPQ